MTTPEQQIQSVQVESGEKPLAGKVFLLTGASRGIGAAAALELCRKGATVIGPHRDPGKNSRASEVVDKAAQFGGKLISLVADVTKAEDRKCLMHYVKENFGSIDGIILNHAGGLEKGADEKYSLNVNGYAKLALFEEAQKSGTLKDQALILDIPSMWSKFCFTGVKQMDVYEPVAKGKKLGEKLLREAIRLYNDQAEEGCHIKFGMVCGQGVAETITMRLLDRIYPQEVAEIKKAAHNGKLPEITEMALAVADMAKGNFRDEEVTFVGSPQIKDNEMPTALPMYSPQTRYVDSLLKFDDTRSFGFYRISDKDTLRHFSYFELMSLTLGTGSLSVTEQHTEGHFVPEFGLSILPGHKIVAAAVDLASVHLEDNDPDFIIPRLKRIQGIEFKIPALPGDNLSFTQTTDRLSVNIGDMEATTVSGVEFEPRNLEDPKNMTPDRLIEAGAQTLGVAYIHSRGIDDVLPLFSRVGPLEYHREVFPGELLEMEAVLRGESNKQFQGDVIFRVDDEVVAKAFGYACQLRARTSIERGIRMMRRGLK
ncbi:SDR family NAD(P)-dependent oxidoreductase [Candidatus Daviesbacteria bacterium]|nr:SDR family NAD(P)-dependent oxidoreductase [Candidatus Daviesbacteria bacterium]